MRYVNISAKLGLHQNRQKVKSAKNDRMGIAERLNPRLPRSRSVSRRVRILSRRYIKGDHALDACRPTQDQVGCLFWRVSARDERSYHGWPASPEGVEIL